MLQVLPNTKMPIVSIGAGGIVKDAHLPAYRKADFEVKAIYDLDTAKAEQLASDFGIMTVCNELEDLIEVANTFGLPQGFARRIRIHLTERPAINDDRRHLVPRCIHWTDGRIDAQNGRSRLRLC